ncbi:MAG: hypothetical protein S4CHLAM45_07930 [Chlamydiales bacterium]|nr:hypothetical protein [Chlamydiales bacterium]MCH9619997.1 hypothetical protein [Chlamydiales bacterium]MCH9622899.1 hypothetical protein [Chlamydiales bacterium]
MSSITITETHSTQENCTLNPSWQEKVHDLILKIQGSGFFAHQTSLLDRLERGETSLLTLAHLYFRILSSVEDAPFVEEVAQLMRSLLPEGEEIKTFFEQRYHQEWARQIIGSLRELGQDENLLAHFEKKLANASLATDDEREDVSLSICFLLFEMEMMEEELIALLAITVPSNESVEEFRETYNRGKWEHELAQEAKQLEARIDKVRESSLGVLNQSLGEGAKRIQAVQKAEEGLGRKVLDHQERLAALAEEMLAL